MVFNICKKFEEDWSRDVEVKTGTRNLSRNKRPRWPQITHLVSEASS